MGDSYLETSNLIRNIFRWFFAFLDRPAYWLLGLVYELFFNVASADLFANATVMKFYGRVQLILGVFMMFQLAMTILRGIVNPDSFTDTKSGAGNLITRIITALVLLTMLMPINVSPRNEYETQIHNNGLLFGTLYSLQHRLLANNTLGRLVLGVDADSSNYLSPKTKKEELQQSARIFTSTILKGFYRINLLPESERPKHEDGKDDAVFNANRVCQDIDDKMLEKYTRVDADPGEIIGMVNETCETDFNILNHIPGVNLFAGSKMYVFAYMPFISMIVAYIFVFILLSFTVDVAVRAVKLAILRLIAPIPIISYMDPKGSKDSAFNSWVKTLTSTYLDLFIRLASVYFVIFLIEDIIKNGLYINQSGGLVGRLSFVIICIGLFIFAKQAPKFIKDVLGLKNEPGRLFGGIGEAMGAMSLAAGTIGSFHAAATASRYADITNNKDPNNIWNRGKHILAGFAGAGAGAATGFQAWQSAKDHPGRATMEAIHKRNAADIQRGASGSTFMGRMGANISRTFQGEGATSYDAQTRNIAQLKGIEKSGKDLFSYLEGKGKTDGADYVVNTAELEDAAGNRWRVHGSLNEFTRAKAQALADLQSGRGNGSFTYDGRTYNANDAIVTKIEEELAYAAGDQWAERQETMHAAFVAGTSTTDGDQGYMQKKETYNESVKTLEGTYGTYRGRTNQKTTSQIKKMSKKAGGAALHDESSEAYKKAQADHNAAGGKK